ncbi:hypothetical protein Prudu_021442, partial [Prunus dulcis]
RPFDFQATARPPQAEPISAVGTIGSASVSPSRPDRPPPRGRPELAGKSCFPTEVPSKPPELPAQNSPSFLHQIDRAPGARQDCKRDLRRVKAVEVRGIHHRANHSLRAKQEGQKGLLCPTFARCRTRTGLGSNSKAKIGSGPVNLAPGARQDCKRDLRRVKAVEVRGIHHRANHSFRAKGRLSAEV